MAKTKKFITCDGNYAAAHIAYMFSEVSCIYPITPSSTMAEHVDEWAANGRKNIFGDTVKVVEMQSEAGAAGAVHGALQAGTLATTYTASQGLFLMIPNMYKIAGELLPCVFHVTARTVASQALSIFGDHSDVYSTRASGFAMLATGSVQEVMDLGGVAHFATLKTRVPFLHFFDGFRTSHEIQKIEVLEQADIAHLIDQNALQAFRERSLNPEHPVTRGTAMNSDIFFQSREACNPFYDSVADVVEDYMAEIKKITGREYHPFDYYGDPEAENIIVAMGSVTDTIKETVDYMIKNGEKVGLISVHLYRPFSSKYFFNALPKSVKRICVIDRTKEPGAHGQPLYLDVVEMFNGRAEKPVIIGGIYGLASKDTTPSQIIALYKNLAANEPKNDFTLGIVDDVTFKSLPLLPEVSVSPAGNFEAKFYGLGADGTVGANKNSIKIIGETTDKYCQAYFAYDSKKSGGFTASHLRFGDVPIRSPYLVNNADFIACHVPAYINLYDVLAGLKKGGSFLYNCMWSVEEALVNLPDSMKKYLAENENRFFIINATKIGEQLGLGGRTNTVMQSAFFKIAEVIPYDQAVTYMKKAVLKSYGKKGEKVVNMNYAAIDAGASVVEVPVPAEWKNIVLKEEVASISDAPEFVKNIVFPVNALKGDFLKVSAFTGREDGTFENGTAAFEKRGIAVSVPNWVSDTCTQCNQCAYVCPHACIRPFLVNADEMANAPEGTVTKKAVGKGLEGYGFRIQVSPLDCTGCGNCVEVCPSPKQKSLVMNPLESQGEEVTRWTYFDKNVSYKDTLMPKEVGVKNSQFAQPLFEFSGACAGCGETPYIKLITQLYGERMVVANATGCSSIYGGSAPSTPYCANKQSGKGPAWGNSLFEDNAEYGLGMQIAADKMRERISTRMKEAIETGKAGAAEAAFQDYLTYSDDGAKTEAVSAAVLKAIEGVDSPLANELRSLKQYMVKKSVWVFGGDGWAYDIGYGGLDHVLASGMDINVLVMDTEVYSNTGGQSSKATPVGAVAKFAASGKRIRKKDLGMMAMSYGYVYVAQVAMGSNQAQYMKAVKEAEAYKGPSLIIAYSPCINHGLKAGMGQTQGEAKKAVECGYWHTYRFNPMLEAEGKNPFILDSKEPDWSKFQAFLAGEVRYTSLQKAFPDAAQELFVAAEANSKWRYNQYKRLAQQIFTTEEVKEVKE